MKPSSAIRQEFIAFFEEKGHRFVRSAPVVPQADPTLLFTNAGMNQFKDIFLSTGKRDYTRAVNTQKCIRASGKHNDLEDVGRDNFHHTFFEMLGNWSFGDYFKEEAIGWAWELLVDRWKLPPDRLYATVFGGDAADGLEADTESAALWARLSQLPPERIQRHGKKANFWEMGDHGPCGPCTEIHMDMGEGSCPNAGVDGHVCQVNADHCWRFVELWNLVFIQYNRKADGSLEPLPERHVDTGMGFERICRVLQGVGSNYDTDLFTPLLAAIGRQTGAKLEDGGEVGVAFRVIADHLRTLSFAIADGALPSNEGRGYVLRRILRRASRFGRVLGMREPFLHQLVPDLARLMAEAFPELAARQDHIMRVIKSEEESFGATLDRGLEMFENIAVQAQKGAAQGPFPGQEAFKLYDTYGFPVDLTQLMARERGLEVDMATFEKLMEQQRETARAAQGGPAVDVVWHQVSEGGHSVFLGYQALESATSVRSWSEAEEGRLRVLLAQTPFYGESGGQVGDQGVIEGEFGQLLVEDTQKEGDGIVHLCRPQPPQARPNGGPVTARVDAARRAAITANHTATHLLHKALKTVLGDHVNQSGSLVAQDQLRFDYTHFEKPTSEQLEEIETIVNREIRANTPLDIFETGYQQALKQGVTALFGEKYGDQVRVVKVGGFSAELCGGCHVRATGDIGLFRIVQESAVAAGVRRMVAITAQTAERTARAEARLVEAFRQTLNVPQEALAGRLEQLMEEKRGLEKELKAARAKSMAGGVDGLLEGAKTVAGVQLVAASVQAETVDELRGLADQLRKRMAGGVAILGAEVGGKGMLLCAVSDALVKRGAKSADMVNLVAALAGGRGGGPPHMATAGAKEPQKISQALEQAPKLLEGYLAALG